MITKTDDNVETSGFGTLTCHKRRC